MMQVQVTLKMFDAHTPHHNLITSVILNQSWQMKMTPVKLEGLPTIFP